MTGRIDLRVSDHATASPVDHWADVRGKRMSQLDPEQTDRANELWTREQFASFPPYYQRLFTTLHAVIDRLRAPLLPAGAVLSGRLGLNYRGQYASGEIQGDPLATIQQLIEECSK